MKSYTAIGFFAHAVKSGGDEAAIPSQTFGLR